MGLFYSHRVSDLFSTLEDAELDALVEDVLKRHPNAGYKMMVGHLSAQGIRVQSKAGFVPLHISILE